MFIVKNNMTTLNSWLKLAECICFLRLMLVYGSPSLPIKKKIKKKETKEKNYSEKSPQIYHDPWMQNLLKRNYSEKKKITMAHECQIWYVVTRLYI